MALMQLVALNDLLTLVLERNLLICGHYWFANLNSLYVTNMTLSRILYLILVLGIYSEMGHSPWQAGELSHLWILTSVFQIYWLIFNHMLQGRVWFSWAESDSHCWGHDNLIMIFDSGTHGLCGGLNQSMQTPCDFGSLFILCIKIAQSGNWTITEPMAAAGLTLYHCAIMAYYT